MTEYRVTEVMMGFILTDLGHINKYLLNKDDVFETIRLIDNALDDDNDTPYYEVRTPGLHELLYVKSSDITHKAKTISDNDFEFVARQYDEDSMYSQGDGIKKLYIPWNVESMSELRRDQSQAVSF